MPGWFNITTPKNTLDLDFMRQAAAAFTVSNTSEQFIRGRAILVTEDATVMPWLQIDGNAERDFAVAGTEQYLVKVKVPPKVPEGNYTFRLDMVDTSNTDEHREQGPTVVIKVPKSVVIPWIPIAIGAGVLLLVIIGVILFLALRKDPMDRFNGVWNLNFGQMELGHSGNHVTGVFTDTLDSSTGSLAGDVANDNFTGTWTGNGSGSLQMKIDSAGTTMDGTRQGIPGGTGQWCGAKGSNAFPPGCSFAGVWQASIDGTPFTVTLTLKMPNVTGTYALAQPPPGSGIVTGTVQLNNNSTTLNGSYEIIAVGTPTPPLTGTFQFFINGYNANQFQGNWRESASRTGAWCGQRVGQPAPNPCRRP